MLSNLKIENIAVIKKAVIDFKDGFNVMTGETGAGKSIIIDSLNAVLGERTSRELIRTGCDFAEVTALFYDASDEVNSILNELDIPKEEDGAILVVRKMSPDGKNICKVNSVSVTVSMLKRLGKQLVNIHGQADNQTLLNEENHCSYIDRIAENEAIFDRFSDSYKEYVALKTQLASLNIDEEQKLRRMDMLDYQIAEIEAANVKIGEWDELREKQTLFRNIEKLSSVLSAAYAYLEGDDEAQGAVSLSFSALNKLNSVSDISKDISELSSALEEKAYDLSAIGEQVKDLLDSLDFDENSVALVEERLDVLYELSKKYGKTEEDILNFYNNAVEERNSIENSDEIKRKLTAEVNTAYEKALENAKELSKTRIFAGNLFSKNVCEELRFLDMPSVRFAVDIKDCPLCENGIDKVEFLLSANVGEDLKPLSKIASGGELSRIMLAIKSVLSEKDGISTLVFDEIDTGVSGSAAQKIAVKLKQVSRSHQVICVTHLAQIAAYADEHLFISKSEHDGQTYTELKSLSFDERKSELTRIMGGFEVTSAMLESAEQMLLSANKVDK